MHSSSPTTLPATAGLASEPVSSASAAAVIDQMQRAIAERDANALAACFAADYRSEQPAHPARAFRGAEVVRQHWSGIFRDVPDLRAETLRTSIDGDTAWQEVHWFGHKHDGALFEVRGMMVMGVAAGKIAWGRLYLEPVEHTGEGLDAAIKRQTR